MKLKKESLDFAINFLETYADKEAVWNMFYKEKNKKVNNKKDNYVKTYNSYKSKVNNDKRSKKSSWFVNKQNDVM